jgi:hypothetical protein
MSTAQDPSARDPRRDTGTSSTATSGGTTSGAAPAGAPGDGARPYVPRPAPGYDDVPYPEKGPRGAVMGLTLMAAVLMMLSGIWNVLEGIAAVVKAGFFVVLPNYAYNVSTVGWGWTHIIIGAVVFVAGACVLTDKLWARLIGVAIASLSAIANFLYIPYYPVWSVIVIAIDLLVVWALLTPRRGYA